MIAWGALLALLAADLAWRRIPWPLSVGLFLTGVAGGFVGIPWSWSGAILAGTLVALAEFFGGDVKAAAVLGGFLGPILVAIVLIVAFALTLAGWRLGLPSAPWMLYVFASLVLVTFYGLLM